MRRFLALVALFLAAASPAFAAHAGKSVGAIRWDPWYISTDTSERPAVESTLGPSKWQGRAPACATATNSYTVSFANCGVQAQIDSEITTAHSAGLDYWAYVWYGPSDPMQAAWRLHQSSTIASNMNWCLMFSSYSLFISEVGSMPSTLTGYFKQSNYQTVLSGRPLVYLLADGTSLSTLATSIATLRTAAASAGAGNPYVVLMVGATSGAVSTAGADAISIYSTATSAPVAGTYASLVSTVEAYWATMAGTGQSVVPTAVTGLDRRPRVERPVSWEVPGQLPYMGDNLYYAAGTTAAIASHIGDMLTWIGNNSGSAPAQTGLIYSWDEHDEGGSTLNPSLGGGSAILNAVAGSL